jgi:hypothetical protein
MSAPNQNIESNASHTVPGHAKVSKKTKNRRFGKEQGQKTRDDVKASLQYKLKMKHQNAIGVAQPVWTGSTGPYYVPTSPGRSSLADRFGSPNHTSLDNDKYNPSTAVKISPTSLMAATGLNSSPTLSPVGHLSMKPIPLSPFLLLVPVLSHRESLHQQPTHKCGRLLYLQQMMDEDLQFRGLLVSLICSQVIIGAIVLIIGLWTSLEAENRLFYFQMNSLQGQGC